MADRPTYLVELVYPPTSDLGYTDASGLGSGGVWIDPNKDSKNYTWQVKWTADIIQEMVSCTNTEVTITNLDLELVVLVFQEAIFSSTITPPTWQTPTSVSDNSPTVTWTFQEASTINTVVDDLISIRSTHNRLHKTKPYVLYHPDPLNTTTGDASHCFDLSPHHFLEHFCSKYSLQSPDSWTM